MQKIIYRVSVSLGRDPLYSVEFDDRHEAQLAAERASRIGFDVNIEPRAVRVTRAA
jgi:hypothetical protein